MAEETTIQPQIPSENRSEERIRQLSEKVELTAKERDEKDKLLGDRDARIKELEQENAFNSGFADSVSTNPAAKDYKDQIKEKVLKGYSVEDATFAVLGKEGKLGTAYVPPSPAGGSAPNQIQKDADKTVAEMSQEERREILNDPTVLAEALRNAR